MKKVRAVTVEEVECKELMLWVMLRNRPKMTNRQVNKALSCLHCGGVANCDIAEVRLALGIHTRQAEAKSKSKTQMSFDDCGPFLASVST